MGVSVVVTPPGNGFLASLAAKRISDKSAPRIPSVARKTSDKAVSALASKPKNLRMLSTKAVNKFLPLYGTLSKNACISLFVSAQDTTSRCTLMRSLFFISVMSPNAFVYPL